MDKEFFKSYIKERCEEFREQYNPEQSWSVLIGKIRRRKIHRICRYCMVAAAMIALLWMGGKKVNQTEGTKLDIALRVSFPEKGSEKAILTLGNGKQVDLSNQYGTITVQQGMHAYNESGNRLIYTDSLRTAGVTPVYNTLFVPRGGEYHLQLSDGTQIVLNAETTLRYPVSFTTETREVYLTGEAYLEVAEDARRPFIVHLGDCSVEVLGTHFNVSAYQDTDIRATLVSGKVKVCSPDMFTVLYPDMQALININTWKIVTQQVNVSRYVSWTKGIYEFRNTSLKEIMDLLGRWYDIDISFSNPALQYKHFTGILYRHEELGGAFEVLERISNITFRREGKKIYVENVR